MLGGLTPEERRVGLTTSLGDAGDQYRELARVHRADCDVVEHEEGFRADADEVVDEHRHEVDAHGVVATDHPRDFEFGTDPVRGGDEHRLVVLLRLQCEETPEAADTADDTFTVRALDAGLDALDDLVAGFDGDARAGVGSSAGDVEQSAHQRVAAALMVTGIGAG